MAETNDHYVYWLGQDGNLWVNQNGNTSNIGTPVGDYYKNGYAEGSLRSMAGQGTMIDDPKANNGNKYEEIDNSSYAASAAKEAAQKANQDKYYDSLINIYQNKLNGMSSTLDELNKKSKDNYDTQQNELQSAYNQNQSDYNKSTTQNSQNNLLTRNTITDNASRGLRSLLRTLGAMGAGGSSAAIYNAPDAVTEQANTEFANAGNEYAQNQQNLDTNWNTYVANWENDKKKSNDAYQSELKANEQNVIQQKNDLLSKILEANNGRAYYGTGSVAGLMDSTTNQINANNNRYNALNTFTPTTYNGMTAVYDAPALSTYNTNNTDLTTQVQGNQDGATTPTTLAMLLGVNRKTNEE